MLFPAYPADLKNTFRSLTTGTVNKIKRNFALGERAFKIGRTTGLTFGEFSAIESDVVVSLPLNDSRLPSVQRTSREWVMTAGKNPVRHERANFCEPGDSGSFVVDRYGGLVGMVWGSNDRGGHAYFTHIGMIVDDIENVTGMKVKMPT